MRELGPQRFHKFVGAELALIEWFEADEDGAAIAAGISAARADRRRERLHVWIFLNDLGDRVLMPDHVVERNPLSGFGAAEHKTAVAAGNKPLGHDREQIDSHARQGQADRNRHKRMRQHALQRPFVNMYDTVVDAFGKATPTFVNQLAGFFMQRAGPNVFCPEQTAGQHRCQGQ